MSKKHKQYLGDAVYADWDGMHVVLTVGDGTYETDRILLHDGVMEQLNNFYKKIQDGKSVKSGSDSEG